MRQMAAIELDIPARPRLPELAAGSMEARGRNNPEIGRWLCQQFWPKDHPDMIIADPMCAVGQLWAFRPTAARVYGCELRADLAGLARLNGIYAEEGLAETWVPPMTPDLISFSPIYDHCDHDSGKGDHQQELVKKKGLQSSQRIEGTTNLLPVFLHIATYRGNAPVAVIIRDGIDEQVETGRVDEVASSMVMAGLGPITRYWYRIPPGPFEQIKVSSGKLSRRTGKPHRVVDREQILVAMPPEGM